MEDTQASIALKSLLPSICYVLFSRLKKGHYCSVTLADKKCIAHSFNWGTGYCVPQIHLNSSGTLLIEFLLCVDFCGFW